MARTVINRDATPQTKGFRLQKLRAALRALSEISLNVDFFYIAIEVGGDIFYAASEKDGGSGFEEDKHYDASFTINSPAVKNTLVHFFDLYMSHYQGKARSIRLAFYTTAKIGKEKNCKIGEKKVYPLLEMVNNFEKISDEVVKKIKEVITFEYGLQYKEKSEKGYLQDLNDLTVEKFKDFLSLISWSFDQGDIEAAEEQLIREIKNCKFYSSEHMGKESIILSTLLELIEKKSFNEDIAARFVTTSDIDNIYLRVRSDLRSEKEMDPAWKLFGNEVDGLLDKRNVKEKIEAVCPDFNKGLIKNIQRKAALSKESGLGANKDSLALKYQVYLACQDIMAERSSPSLTQEDTVGLKD